MSTTTTSPAPIPTGPSPFQLKPAGAPVETAPSTMVAEGPGLARLLGFIGLGVFVVGLVVLIATQAVGPRLISMGWGYICLSIGSLLMLYHAAVDGEPEIRQVYGGFAIFLLIVAVIVSLLPGPFSTGSDKHAGYFVLPYGVMAALMGLLFTVASTRHETDAFRENIARWVLLIFGGGLTLGSVIVGIVQPDYLAGPGVVLGLLGVAFVCGYFTKVDTSEGAGRTVALALGALGALAITYVLARTIAPTVLHDGPSVLRKANGTLNFWPVFGRVLLIGAFSGIAAIGALARRQEAWLRISIGAFGAAGAILFIVASTGSYVSVQPRPFLVPAGVCLLGVGLVYLLVSLGICSDNQFITLTRRELSSYFLSPIGILVLLGMAMAQWLSYFIFVGQLMEGGQMSEPIVRHYGVGIINLFVFAVQIPILTMRLLAEEKRAGSLEVLLTAPVNEAAIVGSKFLGCLLFYLICWLPMGIFLVALTVVSPQPFDYRPMLGFYVCLAAQGAMFIAMGLFFSSLTKNQIVAAMLTFVVLIILLCFAIIRFNPTYLPLPDVLLTVVSRLSFYHMWLDALQGQLPMRDVIMDLSLALFGLFITVKVLEIRKWS